MNDDKDRRPAASAEMEQNVREVFPIGTDPEEFAARDGVGWMDFTFHEYRFSDPELDSWIHRVGRIITDPDALDAAQRKYLSDGEYTMMRKYMDDDLLDDEDF